MSGIRLNGHTNLPLEAELSAAWVFSADSFFPGVASSLTNAGLRRD
ncbi:hypothetical protein [Methylocaldum marinum]|nr:hypothetical protein [Methylocaldum marinum]